MRLTPGEYQAILDGEEWSAGIRADLERQKRFAEKRTRELALTSKRVLEERRIRAWQAETLRKLKHLLADYLEAVAWLRRERVPMIAAEVSNKLLTTMRGMETRLAKARRESAAGCNKQTEWLELHAELIAAVERYRDEQPRAVLRAAPRC